MRSAFCLGIANSWLSHIGHTLGVHNKEYVAILADPALSGETITSRVADQESAGRCA